MSRLFRSAFIPLLAIVLVVWLASNTLMSKPKHDAQGISTLYQLQQAIKKGDPQFKLVVFNPGKRSLTATEADGKTTVTVHYPTDQSATQFQNLLSLKKINFDSKGVGGFSWTSVIASFLPILLLIGFWIFLMNQMQGGGSKVMSFGKSRAKRMAPDSPKIGFKDVAGVDEAVEARRSGVPREPQSFRRWALASPRACFLYGPPGTGKTLLARAVAGEAGIAVLLEIRLGTVEMFVGVGASRVPRLFEQRSRRRRASSSWTDRDAVGRHRGAGLGGGHDERGRR